MRQLKSVASKAVMGAMPFAPFWMASQTVSVPIPTEVSKPDTGDYDSALQA